MTWSLIDLRSPPPQFYGMLLPAYFCLTSIHIFLKKQKMPCGPFVNAFLLQDLIGLGLTGTPMEGVQRNFQSIQEMLF